MTENIDFKKHSIPIRIYYYLLLYGQLIIMLLLIVFIDKNFKTKNVTVEFTSGMIIIMLFLTMFGIIFSKVIFTRRLQKTNSILNSLLRLKAYNYSLVLKYSIQGIPAIFGLFAYSITGSITLLVFSGILYFLMLVERPTAKKMQSDFEQLND